MAVVYNLRILFCAYGYIADRDYGLVYGVEGKEEVGIYAVECAIRA